MAPYIRHILSKWELWHNTIFFFPNSFSCSCSYSRSRKVKDVYLNFSNHCYITFMYINKRHHCHQSRVKILTHQLIFIPLFTISPKVSPALCKKHCRIWHHSVRWPSISQRMEVEREQHWSQLWPAGSKVEGSTEYPRSQWHNQSYDDWFSVLGNHE